MKINTVTVIGATGTMGKNVAAIFASFGNAKVYVIGRSIEKVKKTIPQMIKSVRADSIRTNLIPADFSMIEKCVAESDLIFESSVEDMQVKKDIASLVFKSMRKDAISCTGSSGLSITEIAETYPENLRGNFFGVHMFNPPYSMPLCELVSTKYSNQSIKEELSAYLEKNLYRTIVEVKDTPAFLANRIGFQFINEALQYAERYKDNGGIDYIDAILGTFTGRSMEPLVTADFVGLDVHKAIVDNLYENTNDWANKTFELPKLAAEIIKNGNLGKKTGEGLYKQIKYDNGTKLQLVLDIKTGGYREKLSYKFPFAESMKADIKEGNYIGAFRALVENHSVEADICLHFLLKYIVYSLQISKEVASGPSAADDAMVTGFNWCPPIAMYEALGSVTNVKELMRDRIPEVFANVDIDSLISNVPKSKYDYRTYFKSGR